MKARNKLVLLTLAVVSLAVAVLATVEAATNTHSVLSSCDGVGQANFTFTCVDDPDPVMSGGELTYTISVSSTPAGTNLSGVTFLWFGKDPALEVISVSDPSWACTIESDGTICNTGLIWDGMELVASTGVPLNITGVLTTLIRPTNASCASFDGFANTDAEIPVELQRFVVE